MCIIVIPNNYLLLCPCFDAYVYIYIHINMKERLSKIIASEGLTPSMLADKMGVQRSGISHILTGRNYPSFDFLQKLLENFPRLNAEWLILGQGVMYKSAEADIDHLIPAPVVDPKTSNAPILPDKPQILSSREDDQKKQPEPKCEISPPAEVQKNIEKMMVLYSDKTFVTYFPEKNILTPEKKL